MKLPRGSLVRSRVATDPATPLATALDRELTGYAVLEPQDSLLLDAEGKGVLTFADGAPVLAYHTGTDRGGPSALADLALPGPYRVKLYELDPGALEDVHDTPELRVAPGMAADRLAGDPSLAARTRDAAPERRRTDDRPDDADAGDDETQGAVAAFLDDAEKIEAIREQAREEARNRAEEWGLDDELQ